VTELLTYECLTDALLADANEEDNTKVTRFANYLRIVLAGSETEVNKAAAKVLG
jgi:hypothetical protein